MVNAAHTSATHATTPPSLRRAKISHHPLVSVLPALFNRHKMQLESSVTSRKQTTAPNSYRHKFGPNSAPALRAPAVTTHDSPLATPKSATVSSNPLFPNFLIATLFALLRMLGASPLTSLDSPAALTGLHPSPTMKSVPSKLRRIAHCVAAVADHGPLITNHYSLITGLNHV
jgi:hypothetical protein